MRNFPVIGIDFDDTFKGPLGDTLWVKLNVNPVSRTPAVGRCSADNDTFYLRREMNNGEASPTMFHKK